MGKNDRNSLASRMKRYETSYNIQLPPSGYIIIRLDGKQFSKYTKNLIKPFDEDFSTTMDKTTETLCEFFNPNLAYTQSDEISLVLSNFNKNNEMMYDGKLQKLVSISASITSGTFNKLRMLDVFGNNITAEDILDFKLGDFDSRVFLIPDYQDVYNYFVWRQLDCERNSINMAHYSAFGSEKGINKSSSQKQDDLMLDANINWNNFPIKYKRGVVIKKESYTKSIDVERKRWVTDYKTPIFTKNPDYLCNLISKMS